MSNLVRGTVIKLRNYRNIFNPYQEDGMSNIYFKNYRKKRIVKIFYKDTFTPTKEVNII